MAEVVRAAAPPQSALDAPESPALETWRRFTRHRVGVVALGVVLVLFALSFLGRFLVASDPFVQHRDAAYWPPQRVRVIDAEGRLTRPFVYGFERALHPETFQWEYAVDESNVTELALFARGPVYRVLWLFDWDVHLVGTVDGAPVFFLGTDRFGRDLLARLLWGGMVSLSVPVLAVAITVLLGTLIGAVSGYFGGWVDNLIQRVIEVLASFPRLPLWMALAAVIPPEFQGVALYAGMAVILAIIGWGRLARQVRGKVLQLRQMEYVVGARGARRVAVAGHRQVHRAQRLQPHHRDGHPVRARVPAGGEQPELPGHRPDAAADQLGRAAVRRPEGARGAAVPVAADPRPVHLRRHAGLQLRRRRRPRRLRNPPPLTSIPRHAVRTFVGVEA